MNKRKTICSQQTSCLSCILSSSLTGKDCRELTSNEIKNIIGFTRELEKSPLTIVINSFKGLLRKEYSMYINGKWYEEPEINAYVNELLAKIQKQEEELRYHNANTEKPDKWTLCLVYLGNGTYDLGVWTGKEWVSDNRCKPLEGVKHWKVIKLPKEEM